MVVRVGCGRTARCLMVPAFSLANGRESDSVLELDCGQRSYHQKANVFFLKETDTWIMFPIVSQFYTIFSHL
jgi:hypothetical protein